MMPLIPRAWNTDYLRAILPFGAGFQFISIVQVCFDPMTKGLLSKFGGLDDVAIYELASKMVVQLRLLLVNANQAMVPRIAQASIESTQGVVVIYRRSVELLVFFSFPIYSLMLINLPVISLYWIGRISDDFILYSIMLTVGWAVNLVSGPSYFGYVGEGRLRWVIAGQSFIALLNLLFGVVLGYYFAGKGVVAGWGAALALGSLLVIACYMREHGITLKRLLRQESVMLVLLCIAWCLVTVPGNISLLLINAGFLLSVFGLIWINPLRKELLNSIR
jgi:O-antigen/teichoic acid export membrane protein